MLFVLLNNASSIPRSSRISETCSPKKVVTIIGLFLITWNVKLCLLTPLFESSSAQTNVKSDANYKMVTWVHIPKTGTGLGILLLATYCPGEEHKLTESGVTGLSNVCRSKFNASLATRKKDWPLGDHFSLGNVSTNELASVYVMIRSPWTRIPSGYNYMKRHNLINTSEQFCEEVRNTKHAHFTRGAQVKMLVGHKMRNCNDFEDPSPPSWHEAHEACEKLNDIKFVGLTDFWNTSSCIFGQMHGIQSEKWFSHLRKSGKETNPEDCGDIWDRKLYQCALNRLLQFLSSYPHCNGVFVNELLMYQDR